ncbi:MAG: hypothetical protein M3Y87_25660, partial [Myxococcota bacterium]|nr:hypothetical protein [Myxococcota bacterium]
MTTAEDTRTLISEVIDPLMLASHARKFFESLAPRPGALITLWVLTVQIHRNGLTNFLEDEPAFMVGDVPRAAALLGEDALAQRFDALLPTLRKGRAGRMKAPAESTLDELGGPITRLVIDGLEQRLLASAQAMR